MYETTKTTVIDYHQKPVSEMTTGELRAYRRELARAALMGFCANEDFSDEDPDDIARVMIEQADAMIEHERREEREGGK